MANDEYYQKKKKIYDAASSLFDVGDEQTFMGKLEDEEKRKKLYDALSETYDLGEYDSFSQKMGYSTAKTATEDAGTQAEAATQQVNSMAGGAVNEGAAYPSSMSQNTGQTWTVNESDQQSVAMAQNGVGYNYMPMGGNIPTWDKPFSDEFDFQQQEYEANVAAGMPTTYRDYEKGVNNYELAGQGGAMLADIEQMTDEDFAQAYQGTMGHAYRMLWGEKTSPATVKLNGKGITYDQESELRSLVQMAQMKADAEGGNDAEVQRYEARANELLGEGGAKKFNEYLQREVVDGLNADVDAKLAEVSELLKDQQRSQASGWSNGLMLAAMGTGTNAVHGAGAFWMPKWVKAEDMPVSNETDKYEVAAQILKGTKKHLEEYGKEQKDMEGQSDFEKKYLPSINAIGRGTRDALTDLGTWDFGLTDLRRYSELLSVVNKWEKNEELTAGEQALLDAAATQMAVEANARLNGSYNAGVVTGEMAPFMLEIALNPIAKVGEGAGSKVARYMLSKGVGRKMSKFVGGVARAGVDIAVTAPGMALTTGSLKTAGQIENRMIGDIKYEVDDNGRVYYDGADGREDISEAVWKGLAQQSIEYQSEMVGEYLAPMSRMMGKAMRSQAYKALGEQYYRNLYGAMTGVGDGTVRSIVRNVGKGVKVVKKNGKVSDWAGETTEEIVGGLENAWIGTTDQNAWEGGDAVLSWNNISETALMMLPSQIMFAGLPVAMGGAGYTINKSHAIHREITSNSRAKSLIGKDRWQQMKQRIDEADADNIVAVTKELTGDESGLSNRQKMAVTQYVIAKQYMKGMKMAQEIYRTHNMNAMVYGTALDKGEAMKDPSEVSDWFMVNTIDEENLRKSGISDVDMWIDAIIKNPAEAMERMYRNARDYRGNVHITEEQMMAAERFAQSASIMRGVQNRLSREGLESQTQFNDDVRASTHKDGQLHPVVLADGRRAYVTAGTVVAAPDGTVDMRSTDSFVTIYVDGNPESVGKNQIASVGAIQNPFAAIDANNKAMQKSMNDSFKSLASGTVDASNGNDVYVFTDENGSVGLAKVIGFDESTGMWFVNYDGGAGFVSQQDLDAAARIARMQRVQALMADRDGINPNAAQAPVATEGDTAQENAGETADTHAAVENEGTVENTDPFAGKKLSSLRWWDAEDKIHEGYGYSTDGKNWKVRDLSTNEDSEISDDDIVQNSITDYVAPVSEAPVSEHAEAPAAEAPVTMIDGEPDWTKITAERAARWLANKEESGMDLETALRQAQAELDAAIKEKDKWDAKEPKVEAGGVGKYQQEKQKIETNRQRYAGKVSYWYDVVQQVKELQKDEYMRLQKSNQRDAAIAAHNKRAKMDPRERIRAIEARGLSAESSTSARQAVLWKIASSGMLLTKESILAETGSNHSIAAEGWKGKSRTAAKGGSTIQHMAEDIAESGNMKLDEQEVRDAIIDCMGMKREDAIYELEQISGIWAEDDQAGQEMVDDAELVGTNPETPAAPVEELPEGMRPLDDAPFSVTEDKAEQDNRLSDQRLTESKEWLDRKSSVEKAFGIKIVESNDFGDNENGRYDASNHTIYVNSHLRPTVAVGWVIGHELTHRMKDVSGRFEEYKQSVIDYMGEEQFLDEVSKRIKLYAKHGIKLSIDDAMEEVCADFGGSMLHDGKLMDRFLERQNMNFIQKLIADLRDMLAKAAKWIKEGELSEIDSAIGRMERMMAGAEKESDNGSTDNRYSIYLGSNTDNEGNRFFERNGSIDLWDISKLISQAGRQVAPVRLTDRNLDHIYNNHRKELGDKQSIIDFIERVLSHGKVVRKASGATMYIVLENDKNDSAAIIKLMPHANGDYYNIDSAGYYRKSYWKKKNRKEIGRLSEPASSDTDSETNETHESQQVGDDQFNAMGQSSYRKDSNIIANEQENSDNITDSSEKYGNYEEKESEDAKNEVRKSITEDETLGENYGDVVRYSIVDDSNATDYDRQVMQEIAEGRVVKVFRAMQVVEIDGKRYALPPMASKINGEWVQGLEIRDDGTLEPLLLKADEHPELADDKGNFKLDKGNGKSVPARYNPYWHVCRGTMLNDQFAEAQSRPNLITVEGIIPTSELSAGYKAEKAKDAVGSHDWKPGIIQGQIVGKREVILSRYFQGLRVIPDDVVAKDIFDFIDGKVDVMPTNVVPPAVRAELEKLGVQFVETDNLNQLIDGEHKGDRYTWWYGKNAEKNRSKKFREEANDAGMKLSDWLRENGRDGQLPASVVEKTDKAWEKKHGKRYSISVDHGTVTDADGAVRFSITTEPQLESAIMKFARTSDARRLGWVKEQIGDIVQETSDLIDMIHSTIQGDVNYDEFAKKNPTVRVDWRDGKEKPVVTWVRNNIEYKYDMSADTFCINNEAMETVLASPVMADLMIHMADFGYVENNEGKTGFDADDYLRLYETLRDMGFVVPCKGCFDAAARFKMLPSTAQRFVNLVNATIDERNQDPEKFDAELKDIAKSDKQRTIEGLPASASTQREAVRIGVAGDNLTEYISWTQLMSAEGQTKALTDWGGIFRAWQRTGAGRPKDKLLPEPYTGQIMERGTTIIAPMGEKTPSFRAMYVNRGTGLRRNSHSEYRPILVVDEIQFMRDAWLQGLCVFKYMKELDDVRLFGRMGVKFNMSAFAAFVPGGVAAGLDADGNYAFAEESVGGREFEYVGPEGKTHYDGQKGFEEAKKYINKDCSLSCVAFSVPHLIKLLTDVPTPKDRSGQFGSIIPFHPSGATNDALEKQGLGRARANGVGHSFEDEAYAGYDEGVTSFEQNQNDRFGKGWRYAQGKKQGNDAEGHKIEFQSCKIWRHDGRGITYYSSLQTYEKNGGVKGKFKGLQGPFYTLESENNEVAHPFSVDYNDKVRELGGKYAYKEAADYYIKELRRIGLMPRFDFDVPADVFVKMCEDARVDPHHPKLGWKGEGNSWSPCDAESYYSLFCDYGMTDPETGYLAPHRPVLEGQKDPKAMENAMGDNYLEVIADGVRRYSERKGREDAKVEEAIVEYCRRSVEDGKMDRAEADGILKKHGVRMSISQDEQIHSDAFKAWFGDWEGDPENSSKVVDEEGRPLVVRHATDNDFYIFDKDRLGENTDGNASSEEFEMISKIGFWFNDGNPKDVTMQSKEIECYIDIKEPLEFTSLKGLAEEVSYFEDAESFVEKMKSEGFDGIIVEDEEFGGKSYIAFDNNQIKSATDNNGEFSRENPDIRYSISNDTENNKRRGRRVMDLKHQMDKAKRGELTEDNWLDFIYPFKGWYNKQRNIAQYNAARMAEVGKKGDENGTAGAPEDFALPITLGSDGMAHGMAWTEEQLERNRAYYRALNVEMQPIIRQYLGAIDAVLNDDGYKASDWVNGQMQRLRGDVEYAEWFYAEMGRGHDVYMNGRGALRPIFREDYSTRSNNTEGMDFDAVEAAAADVAERLGVTVNVRGSVDEVRNEYARREIERQLRNRENGELYLAPKAWFDRETGEVEVYAPMAESAADVEKSVLHEVVGHKGLRQLLSGNEAEYRSAMLDCYDALNADQRGEVTELASRMGYDYAEAMDEWLSRRAEDGADKPAWWRRVAAVVRNLLRKMGIDVELSDGDVRYLLWRSRKTLENGGKDSAVDMAEDTVMRWQNLGRMDEDANGDGGPDGGGLSWREDVVETDSESTDEDADVRMSITDDVRDLERKVRERDREIDKLRNQVDRLRRSREQISEVREKARKLINKLMTPEAGYQMGATQIRGLISTIDNAQTAKDVDRALENISVLIGKSQLKAEMERINKYLKAKTQSLNARGQAKGVLVDAWTARIIEQVRSTYKDLLKTRIDTEVSMKNREIARMGTEINQMRAEGYDAQADERMAEQERLKQERDELQELRDDIMAQKTAETIEMLERDNDALNTQIDDLTANGKDVPDELLQEKLSLPIRIKIAMLRNMIEQKNKAEHDSADALEKSKRSTDWQEVERLETLAKDKAMEAESVRTPMLYLAREIGDELKDLLDEGKSKRHEQIVAEIEHRKEIVRMGIAAVKKNAVQDPNAPITDKEERGQRMDKLISKFNATALSFNHVMKMIDVNHPGGEGALYDYFMRGEHGAVAANDQMDDGIKEFTRRVDEKCTEVFGKPLKKVMAECREVDDSVDIPLAYTEDSNWHRKGDTYSTHLSKGQALYMWLTWRQEQGRKKMERNGWNIDSVQAIEDYIGTGMMKFGEWVTEEFLPELREDKYSPTYERVYGTPLHKVYHYFPIHIYPGAVVDKDEIGERSPEGAFGSIAGNTVVRTDNNLPIDASTDAFEMLLTYGTKMERFNAMAELQRDLNILRGSKAFRDMVEANHAGMFDRWKQACQVCVGTYSAKMNDFSDQWGKIQSGFMQQAIGFRWYTALKQMLSFPAFYAYSGDASYMANLSRRFWTPVSNAKWARENLPSYRQRIAKGDMGIEGLNDKTFFDTVTGKISSWGMWANKTVDSLTVAAGARAVFEHDYKRYLKEGKSEDEARRLAIINAEICFNESQQSSRPEFSAPIQKDRDLLSRGMNAFQNSNIGYRRAIIEGWQDIMRADDMYKRGKITKEEKNQTVWRGIRKMVVFAVILPGLWQLGIDPSIFFGRGDDDDEQWAEKKASWWIDMAAAVLEGMLLNGTNGGQLTVSMAEKAKSKLVKDDNARINDYDPLQGFKLMQDSFNDIIKDMQEGDYAGIARDAAIRASQMNGVNPETFTNMGLGIWDAIENRDIEALDMMLLLNMPMTKRAEWVKRNYVDADSRDMAEAMTRALGYWSDYDDLDKKDRKRVKNKMK